MVEGLLEKTGSHLIVFSLRQVERQGGGVVLVDLGRDLVEPGDEGVLDPVDEELAAQHEQAVGGQRPEALCKEEQTNYVAV